MNTVRRIFVEKKKGKRKINEYLLGHIMHTGAAVLLFLLPPPYVLPIFADEPGQRVAISSALSALTFVSLLLFAVMTVLI